MSRRETLYLDLGPACNLRCRMCRLWALEDTPTDVQALLRVAKTLLYGRSVRGLQVIGGEPFCEEAALLATLSFGLDNKIPVSLVTNGTLCDQRALRCVFEKQPNSLAVSLDSIDASVHDCLRGMKGAHSKALRALEVSIALRRDMRADETWIIIINVLNSQNILHADAMVILAESLGVDGVVFQPLVAPFGSRESHHEYYRHEMALVRARAQHGVDTLLALQREHSVVLNTAEDILLIGSYLKGEVDLGDLACETVASGLVVHADGRVSRCFASKDDERMLVQEEGVQQRASVQADGKYAQCRASCKMLNCNRATAAQLAFRRRRM